MTSTSPALALYEISLYNTGRISSDKIIAAFAARREQFERIKTDIIAEKPKSRPQHHLIVGQRGMGKTMLLARIAAELRTEPALAERFIPLVFAEEQYAVDRLSKFWLNCLDSLADAREAAKDTKAVEEIDGIVARLQAASGQASKDDQPFADEVYAAFAKAAGTTGQRPVLLVDNLQLVFERIDQSQQHSLRELLMRAGAPILVGASPSPPPQSQDYGAAFYDQFKVHYLRPLSEDEMRELLLHLADAAKRDDVRQRVVQHPARLKVLRQLTGGNPRTTLTLFFLYAEDFAPSVFGDLEGLLDRVTPLYKARFEELTAQQQVIASAIANHWDPVTATKLASTTGLPAGTISAQLDRLEKTGTIERTELFGESRTGYLIAERFFNIWFLMRSASRRQRREVEFLTRFLETFYEPAERSRIARHLMGEDQLSVDRMVWHFSVSKSLSHDPETAEELTRHTELVALREEVSESSRKLRELIDFKKLSPATLAFDELRKKLINLLPDEGETSPEDTAKVILGDYRHFLYGGRESLVSRTGKLSKSEVEALLSHARVSSRLCACLYSKEASDWFSQRISSGQIRTPLDVDDWNRAILQADVEDFAPCALLADSLPLEVGRALSKDAISKLYYRLGADEDSDGGQWCQWADTLHHNLGRYDEALDAYNRAIQLDGACIDAWLGLGDVQLDYCRDLDAAERSYRKACELSKTAKHTPIDARPWLRLGVFLMEEKGDFKEAEKVFATVNDFGDGNEEATLALISLQRDYVGVAVPGRQLEKASNRFGIMCRFDAWCLTGALQFAYAREWESVASSLKTALEISGGGPVSKYTIDWMRACAVLLHLNYGAELIQFLDQLGDTTARLRPWVEAIRALQIGDRRALLNVAPEIRTTAEVFYEGIEKRLLRLPESTRRLPVAKPKRTRSRPK